MSECLFENIPDRNWVEINLPNLSQNAQHIKELLNKDTKLMGVVKADGYGHGAVKVAATMLANGVDYLAVATVDEALELRRAEIGAPILILSYTDPARAEEIIKADITQTIGDLAMAEVLAETARKWGKNAKVHIKIDTGMSRIGIDPTLVDIVAFYQKLANYKCLEVEGIFTHFATADEPDQSFTEQQFEIFRNVLDKLIKADIRIPLRHCCNSAATLRYPEYHLDMVRAGGLFYGFVPQCCEKWEKLFRPVLSWYGKIVHIKEVKAGTTLGYGRTFTATKKMKIATVAIGYADGLQRGYSNKLEGIVFAEKIRQVGNICMDACMFDLTDVKETVKTGDIITIIGGAEIPSVFAAAARTNEVQNDSETTKNNPAVIKAKDLAAKINSIDYNVATGIGKRVPRLYIIAN